MGGVGIFERRRKIMMARKVAISEPDVCDCLGIPVEPRYPEGSCPLGQQRT